ncbi:MAG: hypothetical protein IPJ89_04215 [Candidatus Iainarchaeum archaeon]|uniref:Uncharacterized protein n=1 Tax=Candidatus Iainarchaeum sp. TaxID=3101447 RepID=A0A7T9I246_9ARCH|nr:MAG: hypothetical protein IPJ89_04215 [Candidatus Diapherotrites archaeon]
MPKGVTMTRLHPLISFVIVALLVVAGVFAIQFLQPTEVINVQSQIPGLVKVNYLAPKVVLAQGAPANNKLIRLSCPWAVGPLVLPSSGGLSTNNAIGVCSPPSCPASHPNLAASMCYPTGIDIPHTVVPVQSFTIVYPPSPPLLPPPFHLINAPNGQQSPYVGGGGVVYTGMGATCKKNTASPPAGVVGPTVTWCGGSCPNPGESCQNTGAPDSPTCECKVSAVGVMDGGVVGGPDVGYSGGVTEPSGTGTDPLTETGGEGDPSTAGDIDGKQKLASVDPQLANALAFASTDAGPTPPLYTPPTWWFGTVGVCVNVCR